MYFCDNDYLHETEKMMRSIPNFQARRNGVRICKRDMDDCVRQQPPPHSYDEVIKATMAAVSYPPFVERINLYIKEREKNEMNHYWSKRHKTTFEETIEKMDLNNYALISAIYLLTADLKLWRIMKHRITRNRIDFEGVKLGGIQENGYTFFCTAKDLYHGTKHLSISDLADRKLISEKMFAIICTAMAIRRFGINAIQLAERRELQYAESNDK